MLINGGVIVYKYFLANVRQRFEMGGNTGWHVATMRR